MKAIVRTVALAVTLVAGPGIVPARGEGEMKKDGPCDAPERHQFDFWIGNWNVAGPKGKAVGTNRITPVIGGCGLQENWEGLGGVVGTSLNIYNAEDGLWHQTWIDNSGSLLLLKGTFADGKMTMSGETKSTANPGRMTRQRITWEPRGDGTVRQLWESSEDDGKTWTVAFDGIYTKMNPSSSDHK